MKRSLIILMSFLAACSPKDPGEIISLAGEWRFVIDSLDKGVEEQWYNTLSTETINLPGSMAENGKGDEVGPGTPWTGDIIDKSYFTDARYEKYRQPGNIKLPFWLKPVKYYKGPAWYQKEVELPSGWKDRDVVLFLERPHWESTLFVNGRKAGSQNSLAVPHQYNITSLLNKGRNLISIRIDNSMVIPIGVNSHSVSDHTQSNWNGITGDISLRASSPVFISEVTIYPDVQEKTARVITKISNNSNEEFAGKVVISAESFNSGRKIKLKSLSSDAVTSADNTSLVVEYPMGDDFLKWNEFDPSLYRLTVRLKGKGGRLLDTRTEEFGMREFSVEGTRFAVNGTPVFLRGTTECCIFPLTGYPPSDTASWGKVLRTCREYGLNHVRFHSYCPPEAAFEMADRLGIYFHIECSSWANQGTSIGNGEAIDTFIYNEGDRIMREYGNHPSFCMLAYGNEPAGSKQNEYLGKLLNYWKQKDSRRVYTSAAGWPQIPENDYHLTPAPRIHQWGDGLKDIINSAPPQTEYDFGNILSQYTIPVVSHEIGQWCVYPDFSEISKYAGSLKATNFEIFRETLDENNMGDQAKDFLMASGKLQSLCYKAEIEAALRTPGFAGFQLLQLHDFPGQGTALVGILNPFFETKGYITPEEFRMFCSETVPLARIPKMIFRSGESFNAAIEIAHFGSQPIKSASIVCAILNASGDTLHTEIFQKDSLQTGNCIPAGSLLFNTANIAGPEKLRLEVSIKNTPYKNMWDFWVYPSVLKKDAGDVFITDRLNRSAEDVLKKGGSVLLLAHGKIGRDHGAQVAIGFSSIFWNTAWTGNQPPHTLGILCDPENPVFKEFPTEFHSNWQWWDPVMHSQAMIIDDLPGNLKPHIQPIDTWFENRRLALAFESETSGGKLFVCSIDLKDIPVDRPVSQQLLKSILNYMNSSEFNPQTEVPIAEIRRLMD